MAKGKKYNIRTFEGSNHDLKHASIYRTMTESTAWKSLDPYARNVYLEMKMKYNPKANQGQGNARNISMPYTEGMKIMAQNRFKASIYYLIDRGFIDIVEHYPHAKKPTIYGLSDRWKDYGTDKFIKAHINLPEPKQVAKERSNNNMK